MLHHTIFEPDPQHAHECWACLWQGPAPPGLVYRQYLYLHQPGEPYRVAIIWEGGLEAERWFERVYGSFGQCETRTVADMTEGMAFIVARDLVGLEGFLHRSGLSPDVAEREVELRRRGMEATDFTAAVAAARAWAEN